MNMRTISGVLVPTDSATASALARSSSSTRTSLAAQLVLRDASILQVRLFNCAKFPHRVICTKRIVAPQADKLRLIPDIGRDRRPGRNVPFVPGSGDKPAGDVLPADAQVFSQT